MQWLVVWLIFLRNAISRVVVNVSDRLPELSMSMMVTAYVGHLMISSILSYRFREDLELNPEFWSYKFVFLKAGFYLIVKVCAIFAINTST